MPKGWAELAAADHRVRFKQSRLCGCQVTDVVVDVGENCNFHLDKSPALIEAPEVAW
jgi:hypothetical protein